jgi:hypothetical protein
MSSWDDDAVEWAELHGFRERNGIWYDEDGNEVDIYDEFANERWR